MRIVFECDNIQRWALLGYFTSVHLCVQKWNKHYDGDAHVRVDPHSNNVYVALNTVDSYKWMYTWNSTYPQLTQYTILAEET